MPHSKRNLPILCLDFDGVIHSYEKGWQDGTIYGTYVPGFFAWAVEAVKYFDLVIYSSRSSTEDGRQAMGEWLGYQSIESIKRGEMPEDFDWGSLFPYIDFASEKPPAFLTIDDRALLFTGDWAAFKPELLRRFIPWTVRR